MTRSSTARRFARMAIQTSRRCADVGDWALDAAHNVGDGDVVGRAREPIAAVHTPLASHETGVPQVAEDVLEELQRDLLRLCDALALHRRVTADDGELDHGA